MAGIADLTENVVAVTGLNKKDAEAAVKATVGAIETMTTQGEAVIIKGFGSFKVKTRAARTARNPKTGEPLQVPAKDVLTFKAAK